MSTPILERKEVSTHDEPELSLRRSQHRQLMVGILVVALLIVVALTAYGVPMLQLLGTVILGSSLIVVALLAIGALMIALLVALFTRERPPVTPVRPWLQRAARLAITGAILLVGLGAAAMGSQAHASTAQIDGSNGQPVAGSIATLERVTLNGSQQWITIRGKNAHNPVLLFLMGGPGAGGFPDQSFLAPLEDHFVVVNWDQPGTGKSYDAVPIKTLTPQRYISDAHALVMQLRARFHQDKIFVLGSSWGSILGIMLVQQYPDLFYAYVGHGQMVNTTENDIMGYQYALNYAAQHHDTATVDALRRNGPPPYVGDGMVWKYAAYMDVLQAAMDQPALTLGVPLLPWFATEYGLVDRVNYVRGFIETFSTVYPQLSGLDFTQSAANLDVPVYLLVGRADVNAMASLTERYYSVLQAPHKELIWFKSGHSMTGADTTQFVDVMVHQVLAQTQP